jgi:prepilin-type N-terminal cleavage/methylation domain-containing protein
VTRAKGFTLVEAMVGMVIAGMILAACYSVWRTHAVQSAGISKKIDLRNKLTLSSKRLQRSVTLAGFGLSGAANLTKIDAVGSDTLTLYSNPNELKAHPTSAVDHQYASVSVDAPALFSAGGFLAISGGGHAELRRISSVSGSAIGLESPFVYDYSLAETLVFPVQRERFYSDQDSTRFISETAAGRHIVATDVKNFQVSFADKQGVSTEVASQIRTVRFSLTGVFPARDGAINSLLFSSTAIPRNML